MNPCPARRSPSFALLFALLVLLGAAGCRRDLAGARCPCAAGWTCCQPEQDICVLDPLDCPGNQTLPDASRDLLSPSDHPDGAPERDAPTELVADANTDAPSDDSADTSPDARADAGPDAGADVGPDAGTDTAGPPPNLPTVCTMTDWCWTHPLPTGDAVAGIWGAGANDVRIIGARGSILRWDGATWSSPRPPSNTLWAIWGGGSDVVWLGSDDGLFRWDAAGFSMVPPSASPETRGVYALWGAAPNDIWAVGAYVWHYDGSAWSFVTSPLIGKMSTVWGSGPSDVWAGTHSTSTVFASVLHWDGATWSVAGELGATSLAGTGPGDVFAASPNQTHHWDGQSWTPEPLPIVRVFPIGRDHVGAVQEDQDVLSWDGTRWSPLGAPAPARFEAFWSTGPDDIWAGGPAGVVARWDGTAWTSPLPRHVISTDTVTRLGGTSASDVWAIAGGAVLHNDGSSWRVAATPDAVGRGARDLWAAAADDVWVAGADGALHRWNGVAWRTEEVPLRGANSPEITAITGTGPNDVWMLRGTDTVMHWDGNAWTGWQPQNAPLTDVWAAGPDDAWVAGNGLVHWIPASGWMLEPTPVRTVVTALAGTASDDVWGLAGTTIIHYDGDVWTTSLSSARTAHAVSARARNDALVVTSDPGLGSSMFRWDGQSWVWTAGPTTLSEGWIAPDGTAWVGGAGGAILRHAPIAAP